MKKRSQITTNQVRIAVKKFLNHGGFINNLPYEQVVRPVMVGGRFGLYENPLAEINERNTTY